MKSMGLVLIGILASGLLISGCTVRTYPLTRDRIDQDLSSGNKGYLQGTAPAEDTDRKLTRTTQVFEIEIGSPIRIEKGKKSQEAAAVAPVSEDEGNRGYVLGSAPSTYSGFESNLDNYEMYTVQKNDTLQKISKGYFGTTTLWKKIYDLNSDVLKTPDKIRPGQVLRIPTEALKEPKENLK